MKVREIYAHLNEKIPPSLSCSWDNDGLMCCPDAEKDVRRVLIALDATEDAGESAMGKALEVLSAAAILWLSLPLRLRPAMAKSLPRMKCLFLLNSRIEYCIECN